MTSTAEERADGVCAALARAEAAFDGRGWVEMPKADRNRYVARAILAKPLIAQAIRSAENDKLEEAAKLITSRILDFEDSDTDPEFDVTDTVVAYELRQAREDIRSLKSKDTP